MQSPSRQPGNVKSWVCISRGVQRHVRLFTPKVTEHQSSGAVLSPQSPSCGRPLAQTQGAQSQEGYKVAPQRKVTSLDSSAKLEDNPGKNKVLSALGIQKLFLPPTKILRHGVCHEAARAPRWSNVLTLLGDAEDTNKEEWFDLLSRSTDKPRREYCEDQNGTVIYIRAMQGHGHGVTINSDLFSTVDLERTHIPHGQLYKSIRFTGRRSESKKDKTGLFLLSSKSSRTVIATEFDQLNKDSMMNRQRTEMNKHTKRPDNHRTCYFNLRRAHKSNLVFQSGSDAIILSNKIAASALDQVCHFCRRCFVRTEPSLNLTDFNQAGGDTWRTNCLTHIMSS